MKTILYNIWHNIRYFLTHDFYMEENKNRLELLDAAEWNMGGRESTGLKILNQEDTLTVLSNNPKSFCRFGDGEINIIMGRGIPFQKYDDRLAQYLKEILSAKHADMYVGINYYYYHDNSIFNEFNRSFYQLYSYKFGRFFAEVCNKQNLYIDASFNQIYQLYKEYDFETYFGRIKQLFSNKKLVIFSGNGVLTKLQYNLFENAREVIYETGPSKNAFDKFDELLSRAKQYGKEYLLCFILGPTSKALVYELNYNGYYAWDIGHLAKDYNSYMMREERTEDKLKRFYDPD